MKKSLVQNRSSYLVSWPVITAIFVCAILSFIFKAYFLSLLLLIVFLVVLVSRGWAAHSTKELKFSISTSSRGVFPKEAVSFQIKIKNDKMLPVMCMEMYFPLDQKLCLLPEDVRKAEEYEKTYLSEKGASLDKVGEKKLPTILWYEEQIVKSRWVAKKRGIYSTAGWKLRSGDGLGLTQMETAVKKSDITEIAVYPERVPVRTDIFLRNAWNADTGSHGVMEENTVIRSTRDYMPSDNIKSINWRMTARGLPLTVNIYEDVLPKSIYFIFDGESFSGAEKHETEMEEALSIISSLVIELDGRVQAGISFSEDKKDQLSDISCNEPLDEKLRVFAGYEVKEDVIEEGERIRDLIPTFNKEHILEEADSAGRFYYVTYDAAKIRDDKILKMLGDGRVTIISYNESDKVLGQGIYETVYIKDLVDAEGEDG